MKLLLLFAGIVFSGVLSAQRPATVECRIGEGIGKKMNLFKVQDGKKIPVANATYANGYYGFKFIPEYEGFYVVGDEQRFQYPLYLKEGDAVSVHMDKDTVYLEGKSNSPENITLYRWIALSMNIEAKAIRFYRARSTYKDFFPEFEKFLPVAEQFKSTIKTKNPRFNELMKRSVDFEKDLYAISFLYTPRSEHPKKEQRLAYYSTIVNLDKFRDDVLLQMPYGMQLLNLYLTFITIDAGKAGDLELSLSSIINNRLKGEVVLERANTKSYFEHKKMADRYTELLNQSQRKRMEEIGAKLYEMKKGQAAIDFTYPDVNGKMISLSDFKGKVVLVDVWATWCGPCRGEIPHLKKLEEEMKGTDVVFIGVSLDEEKNYEKWKKFLEDESLSGVQLFGNGFSKIAKDYKITGIPRFMVFGRDGQIVEANSPRPSNPDLKKLLEEELKK